MSCLLSMLALVALALLCGPWLLAATQYRRLREQEARLHALEEHVVALRRYLEALASVPRAAPEPPAVVASTPGMQLEQPAEPRPRESAAMAATAPEVAAVGALSAATLDAAPPIAAAAALTGASAPTAPSSVAMASAVAAAAGSASSFAPPVDSPAPPSAASGGPPPPPSASGPASGGAAPPPGDRGAPTPLIDWERWIGVRGAAVLGGIVLALAGILFVRYTIERGLISPAVRIVLGIVTGLAAIGWSERLRKRGYRINADALAGAGVVLLYAAVWASHSLYHFVGAGAAYGLMGLITVACGVLSWRHASLLVAVLGLVGGFATPLLLASETDNPVGLFGYVLLLDLGLIGIARRRGWSSLALMALGGTLFYQAWWVFTRMRADSAPLALGILALFAMVFGFAGWRRRREGEEKPTLGWVAAEVAGLLAPFAFALYLAGRADLGPHLFPTAALLLLLALAAQWIGRRHGAGDLLSAGAAAGALAVVLVWAVRTEWTLPLIWEAVAICVGLAASFHLFFELDRRRARDAAPAPSVSSLVAGIGFFAILLLFAPAASITPWPWLLGSLLVAAMLLRQSIEPARAFTPLLVAVGLAFGAAAFFLAARGTPAMPQPQIYFGVVLLVGGLFQALAHVRGLGAARRFTEIGAAIHPAVILVALLIDADSANVTLDPGPFFATTSVLAALMVLATTRLAARGETHDRPGLPADGSGRFDPADRIDRRGSGEAYLGAMALVALTHTVWSVSDSARGAPLLGLVVLGLTMAAFAFWPTFAPTLGRSREAWRAAALATPAWFWSMLRLYDMRFGDAAIGLLPLLLAVVALASAYAGRRAWAELPESARVAHLAWFGAVVLGLAAVAVPLQLEKEWITVGWALEGLAVVALWRRLDHPGLKWFAAALFAAVTVRLLLNPEVLLYHERSGLPVLNWLAYTYLVPAACLLGAGRILASPGAAPAESVEPPALEVERARGAESVLYAKSVPIVAAGAAVAAILIVFAWINLTIVDAFSTGPTLVLTIERMPARDLTLSLAWILYAVTLLGIGMARDSSALRWASLGFLVLSIGKVFLYDLGELEDLYRVASLVGLAVSLILVSLAYQRFVFRRREEDQPAR